MQRHNDGAAAGGQPKRQKGWEVEMPHDEFMREIRRMSSGTYAAGRSWSEALWDRKDRSSTSDESYAGNGGRAGRPRVMKDYGEGDAR